ncbi:hypothetical protein GC194_07660, partial [bacterium]|nr:hypothetical protein [bacterium]
MRKFYFLLATLFLFFTARAATYYYSTGSGNPATTSNWVSDTVNNTGNPSSFSSNNRIYVIRNGHTMTTSGSGWSISGGSGVKLSILMGGSLVESSGSPLDFTSTPTFEIKKGGSFTKGDASNTCFDGVESFATNSLVTITNYSSSSLPTIDFGSLTINSSSLGSNLSFSASSNSTITINGNLTVTATNGYTFGICAGSASNVTLNIAGDFIINGGIFDFYPVSSGSGGTINVGGNLTFSSGNWNNTGSNNLSIYLTGSTYTNVTYQLGLSGDDAIDDTDWIIATGKSVTMNSNWQVGAGETLTVNGTLNCGTYSVSDAGTGCSFTLSSTGTLGIGSTDGIDASGAKGNVQTANVSYSSAATYIYNGSAAQETGSGLYNSTDLTGTVQISNTSATVSFTESVNAGDNFELVIDDGAVLYCPSGYYLTKNSGSGDATLSINGTFETDASGGFSSTSASGSASIRAFTVCSFGSNGTVKYMDNGNQTITNQFPYQNLTLYATYTTSSANNKTAAGALDINGDLYISGTADFDPNNYQVNLGGDWTAVSGSDFSNGSGTVIFDGSAAQSITNNGLLTFYNLNIACSDVVTSSNAITLDNGGQLTITSGTLDMGTNSLQATASNRTLAMTGGTLILKEVNASNQPNFATVSCSGGTIELGASGAMELNGGETYYNLTFSGSGTKTISSATASIDGTVYITETCTLNVSSSTFGKSATNLTMDGGYLIIDGSGTKPDMNGTYSLSGGTIEFAGSNSTSQNIRSPQTYYNIVVSGSNVSVSSGDYTLANGGSFVVISGATFTTSNKKITTSGTATVTINGTFSTQNSDGFSGGSTTSITSNISTVTLGSSSTIIYSRDNSDAQAITDRDDYANLTLSGSGSKNFTGTPTISGNYSITGGTSYYGSGTTSITFSSSSAQNIAVDDYESVNIILSGGGAKTFSAGNSATSSAIAGDITFSSGVMDLSNYDLYLDAASDISSASSSNGFFNISGTGRLYRTISASSSYIYPVGENGSSSYSYLPVTVSCSSCSNKQIGVGVENSIYEDPTDRANSKSFSSAGYSDYVDKTWDLTSAGLSGDFTVTLQWNYVDQSSSNNQYLMATWLDGTSSAWDNGTVSSSNTVSSGVYSHTRTLSGLS